MAAADADTTASTAASSFAATAEPAAGDGLRRAVQVRCWTEPRPGLEGRRRELALRTTCFHGRHEASWSNDRLADFHIGVGGFSGRAAGARPHPPIDRRPPRRRRRGACPVRLLPTSTLGYWRRWPRG